MHNATTTTITVFSRRLRAKINSERLEMNSLPSSTQRSTNTGDCRPVRFTVKSPRSRDKKKRPGCTTGGVGCGSTARWPDGRRHAQRRALAPLALGFFVKSELPSAAAGAGERARASAPPPPARGEPASTSNAADCGTRGAPLISQHVPRGDPPSPPLLRSALLIFDRGCLINHPPMAAAARRPTRRSRRPCAPSRARTRR